MRLNSTTTLAQACVNASCSPAGRGDNMSAIQVLELVYLGVVDVLILFGNILVILAFSTSARRLKTYTNHFVVNLAVSDLMVGILSVPFWMYVRIDENMYTQDVYKVFISFDVMFGTASILNLMSVSLERLFAVRCPARHFNMTGKPVAIALVMSWLLGVCFAGLSFADTPPRKAYYSTFLFICAFILPTVVIVVSYAMIFQVARDVALQTNSRKLVKEVRVAKMVFIIISLYILSWLPFFAINMIFAFCEGWCKDVPLAVIYITKLLHYSNSMMNFWVYAFRSPDFRAAFKSLLQGKLSRRSYSFRPRTISGQSGKSAEAERSSSLCDTFVSPDSVIMAELTPPGQ